MNEQEALRCAERIEALEHQVRELTARMSALEPAAVDPSPIRSRPVLPTRIEVPLPRAPRVELPRFAPRSEPRSSFADRFAVPDRDALEDLLGGRVLAWVGGLAVLLGIVFLLAMAVSRGWIDEATRTGLAALASTGLLVLGIWLHEHRARTDAALAATAAGIAGLFATVTVAAQVYELIPDVLAIALAIATGALATGLAVRWESRGVGALGILGALLAPVLAGASPDAGTVTILFVALASAAGVLLWLRWDWLALAAFAVSAPQWVIYLFDGASATGAILTLVGFGALGVAMAAGHDLRVRSDSLRLAAAFLLGLNAFVLAVAGWAALEWMQHETAAEAWLTALAIVHIGLGLASPRIARVSPDLGRLALVLGVVIANVAFGLVAGGAVLTVGWVVTGAGFALLYRRVELGGRDDLLSGAGLGGHVALALVHTVVVDAPTSGIAEAGSLSFAGAASVVALAAGCLVSGRLVGPGRAGARMALDALGLAALAYLTALALDGEALAVAWTAEAIALMVLARRTRDGVAGWASLGFLALAAGHAAMLDVPLDSLEEGLAEPAVQLATLAAVAATAIGAARLLSGWLLGEAADPGASKGLRLCLDFTGVVAIGYLTVLALSGELLTAALAAEAMALAVVARRFQDGPAGATALAFLGGATLHGIAGDAPPVSLVTGLADPLGAVTGLGSVAAAALLAAGWLETLGRRVRPALLVAGALVLLYLASGLVVTPFESAEAVDSGLLSAHQQGQMVLSVFWGFVGVSTIVLGLRRDLHALRLAGLALVGVTVAKVFLFDLANLSSMNRVVSFVGLGLLLLVAAFVWQRLRPRVLPDLRETPEGLR